MGNAWSARKKRDLLVVGLESSGKKTLLPRFEMGQTVTVTPTTGFNVNSVENAQVAVRAFDLGGDVKFRPLCRSYYERANAVIFVVDVPQYGGMSPGDWDVNVERAVDEFHSLLCEDALRVAPLLVLAHQKHKHGHTPTASELDELTNKLTQRRRVADWTEAGRCAFLMGTCSEGSAVMRLSGNLHVLELIWGFVKVLEIVSYENVLKHRHWRLEVCDYHGYEFLEGLDWLNDQLNTKA